MHNKISFERLLYKHTESLLNLDITTFCFPPFKVGGVGPTLRYSNNRLMHRKPPHRVFLHPSPPPAAQHITTSTKGFYFMFKGRNRTAPNVFIKNCFPFVCALQRWNTKPLLAPSCVGDHFPLTCHVLHSSDFDCLVPDACHTARLLESLQV